MENPDTYNPGTEGVRRMWTDWDFAKLLRTIGYIILGAVLTTISDWLDISYWAVMGFLVLFILQINQAKEIEKEIDQLKDEIDVQRREIRALKAEQNSTRSQ